MVPCVVDVVCHLTVAEAAAGDGAAADEGPAADLAEPGTRRIVVGVDGSAASVRALRWAVAQRTLVRDDPANAILEAGKDADLLVVGSRGLGVDGEADLGPVGDRVVREARCPVVVVPAE
jgi:nucleotide-binding universal stress UspA family protein